MTAPTHRFLSLAAGAQSPTHGCARANAEGYPLRGQVFLHRQWVSLDEVVLRPRLRLADATRWGLWTCPHEAPTAVDPERKEVA